jgi:hypothetical protein
MRLDPWESDLGRAALHWRGSKSWGRQRLVLVVPIVLFGEIQLVSADVALKAAADDVASRL